MSAELDSRMQQPLGPAVCPGESAIPPCVDLSDGLTQDEAVAVAVWNNAAFLELLAELGISRAQLYDAGLLTDPQFVTFLPLGPKQLEFTLFVAVDAIWLRDLRVRAAQLDLDRVADQMVQRGLDLIRDVRIAHADLLFAQQRADLAREARQIRAGIAELSLKRLDAGDISELEVTDTQVQAHGAEVDIVRFDQEVVLAENRLRELLGLTLHNSQIVAVAAPLPSVPLYASEELVAMGLTMRPDLRAAEIAVEMSAARVDLAHWQFMNLDAVYDANAEGTDGFESGPGLRLTIPIFNANRGGRAIAEAQLQRAMRQRITIRDRVATEVRAAYAQAEQADRMLQIVEDELLPTLETSVQYAQKGYEGGGAPYFLVLQTTGQFLDARVQQLEFSAALRRAIAELERGIGHRVMQEPAVLEEFEMPLGETDYETRRPAEADISSEGGWHPLGSQKLQKGCGNRSEVQVPSNNDDSMPPLELPSNVPAKLGPPIFDDAVLSRRVPAR